MVFDLHIDRSGATILVAIEAIVFYQDARLRSAVVIKQFKPEKTERLCFALVALVLQAIAHVKGITNLIF
jgi:hypothetical protein